MRKGFDWRGRTDEALIGHLAGHAGPVGLGAVADPVSWALDLLDLRGDALVPSRRQIQRAFRDRLRDAHPDHGAQDVGAADRIAQLSEARRILLG